MFALEASLEWLGLARGAGERLLVRHPAPGIDKPPLGCDQRRPPLQYEQ